MKRTLNALMYIALSVVLCGGFTPSALAITQSSASDVSTSVGSVSSSSSVSDTESQLPVDKAAPSTSSKSDSASTSEPSEISDSTSVSAVTQTIESASLSGLFVMKSSLADDLVIDVPGASNVSGVRLQTYSDNNTPAQRYRIDDAGDGYYTITNVSSGKVFDVAAAANTNGTAVQQYDPNGTDAQKWYLVSNPDGTYTIASKLKTATGAQLVLDVPGASTICGAQLQIYEANGTAAQKWSLSAITQSINDGLYTFNSSLGFSKVLDVASASTSNGGNVQTYTLNGTSAQKFQITYDASTGYYGILNGYSGLALDVAGGSALSGANVQQYASNGTNAQRWSIMQNSDGTLTVRSAVSGLVLDVTGGSTSDGANVQVYSSNSTAAQKWTVLPTTLTITDGVYEIAASADDGVVLDVAGGSTSVGGNVQIYASNDTWAQKFAISAYGNTGYYTIRNVKSGLYVGVDSDSSVAGTNVCQGILGPSTGQLWKPVVSEGGMSLLSQAGLTLDVVGGNTTSGTNVQGNIANGSAAQAFILKPTTATVATGVYTIESSLNTSKVIDMPSASTENGVIPQLYTSNDTNAQKYYVTDLGDGYYRIVCLCSYKSLDVSDGLLDSSTGYGRLQQWTSSDVDAQKWRIEFTADGYFTFYSKSGSGTSCIDVKGANTVDGTTVQVYTSNGTAAQKFQLATTSGNGATGGYRTMNMSLADMAGYQLTAYHTYSDYYYYLNPANVPTQTEFADLRLTTNILTAGQIDAYINSSLYGRTSTMSGMGLAIAAAAKKYGVNESYIVAHAALESGWGTSTLSRGQVSQVDGVTYYNFFGIGAYDDSADASGLVLARENGWDSPAKAIAGGVAWIASNYIYASNYSQYTLYDMRWDTDRSNATYTRGWHQYATSLTWAGSIASIMDECYTYNGITPSLSYLVPVYG